MQVQGVVESVDTVPAGGVLDVAATAGDTALQLDDVSSFNEAGGSAVLLFADDTSDITETVAYTAAGAGRTSSLDAFTRADSATSLGTPGIGPAWTIYLGTWGISSNRAYVPTPGAAYNTAVVDSGVADATVEVTISTMPTNTWAGLTLRSSGGVNTGFSVLAARMYDIATDLPIGAAFSQTFVSGDRMRAVMSGTTITIYRQAGAVGAWSQVMTTTSALYQANTKHGLSTYTDGSTARFDDFQILTDIPTGVDRDLATLTLATALVNSYPSGTTVTVDPPLTFKIAQIRTDNDSELLPAHVSHTLKAYSVMTDGPRDVKTAESVIVDQVGGVDTVVEVTGQQPLVDGANIDPDSIIPPAALTDGEPPAASPAAVVASFSVGALLVKWSALTNADPVTYDVYASLTSPVTTSSELVATTAGTSAVIQRLANVQIPLDGVTPVYVRVMARDADGPATAGLGVEGSGVTRKADQEFISSLYAYLGTIEANKITAGELTAVIGISTTGVINVGPRITIADPNAPDGKGGITIWGDDAHTIVLVRLHPVGSEFAGKMTADQITVIQSLRLLGDLSAIAAGARMKIENDLVPPPAAPTLTQGLILSTWPVIPAGFEEKGITWDDDNNRWWQLLWKAAENRAYMRTISAAGSPSLVILIDDALAAGEALVNCNGIAWATEHGWLYAWMRLTQPNGAPPQWQLYEIATNGGYYEVAATLVDTATPSTYPGVCITTVATSHFLYWSGIPSGGVIPLTKRPTGGGAGTFAAISTTGITDVVNMRSMLISDFDHGSSLLHVSTQSGNAYHFTMATFTTPLPGPTLARNAAKDFVMDSAAAHMSYQNTAQAIDGRSLASNVATIYTVGAHGLLVGDTVTVSGVGAPFDGTYTVASTPFTGTFTYAKTNANIAYAAATGTVTSPQVRNLLLAGFYSSKSDSKIARYANYFPSAGELTWAQAIDTGAASKHTAASPESAGLPVTARRFASVALSPAPAGVTGAAVYVGYGATSPSVKLKRTETLVGRSMTLTNNKVIGVGTNLVKLITNKSLTSNVATLTSGAHAMVVGDTVTIAGVGAPFDGTHILTAVTVNTFSYALTNANIASTASGGTATMLGNLAAGTPGELFDDFGNTWKGDGAIRLPKLLQAGTVPVSFASATSYTHPVEIPFPGGAFDAAPAMTMTINDGAGVAAGWTIRAYLVTTTGFRYILNRDSGLAAVVGAFNLGWIAVAKT